MHSALALSACRRCDLHSATSYPSGTRHHQRLRPPPALHLLYLKFVFCTGNLAPETGVPGVLDRGLRLLWDSIE